MLVTDCVSQATVTVTATSTVTKSQVADADADADAHTDAVTHARTHLRKHARTPDTVQQQRQYRTASHRIAPHRAAPRTHTTSATFCTLPLPPSKWARVTYDRAYARACVRAAAVAASVPDLFKHKSLLLGASPAQPPQPARSSQP